MTEKAKPKPRRYFLAAATRDAANLTATLDCGWEPEVRDSVAGWLDAEGNFVRYLGDVAELREVTLVRLYLGLDWYNNPMLADLSTVARSHGIEPIGVAK